MREAERAADAEADEATEPLERVDRLLLGVGDGELLQLDEDLGMLCSSFRTGAATCLPRDRAALSTRSGLQPMPQAGLEQLGLRRRAGRRAGRGASSTPRAVEHPVLVDGPERSDGGRLERRRGRDRRPARSSPATDASPSSAASPSTRRSTADAPPASRRRRRRRRTASSGRSSTIGAGPGSSGSHSTTRMRRTPKVASDPAAVGQLGGLARCGRRCRRRVRTSSPPTSLPRSISTTPNSGSTPLARGGAGSWRGTGARRRAAAARATGRAPSRAGTSPSARRSTAGSFGGRSHRHGAELRERRTLGIAGQDRGELVLEGEVGRVDDDRGRRG